MHRGERFRTGHVDGLTFGSAVLELRVLRSDGFFRLESDGFLTIIHIVLEVRVG